MRFGLTEKTIEGIQGIFSHFSELEEAVLYGSRAMGNYQVGSDIDLTLKGSNLHLATLNKISIELDDLMLPYKLDLSIFDHISNSELKDHIRRVGICFYKRSLDM